MKTTRTINWITTSGIEVKIVITKTRNVQSKTSFSDGWNIDLGREIVDTLEIKAYANGKQQVSSLEEPTKIYPFERNYKELTNKGIYARIGNVYFNQDRYDQIMTAIAEIDAEFVSAEYAELKEKQIAAKLEADKLEEEAEKEYAAQVRNGLCPKCGSYCYGDCTAN